MDNNNNMTLYEYLSVLKAYSMVLWKNGLNIELTDEVHLLRLKSVAKIIDLCLLRDAVWMKTCTKGQRIFQQINSYNDRYYWLEVIF
jgi:hypothetical protein